MAVWTRSCSLHPSSPEVNRFSRNELFKSACSIIKTHVCTVALSLTLVNSVRLPREAFRYGAVPYLVVYTLWLLVVGLATSLLQLSTGQLSQQDPVGVWRAVPILRGVGHIQLITSFICCVYNMVYIALASAYILWIAKDTFPLRACTRLQMTPYGYENKINATECYNMTFLSSYAKHPQYLAIMAIIIFLLWFFVPLFMYGLEKSYKIALSLIAPFAVILPIVLSTFLSQEEPVRFMLMSGERWMVFTDPHFWFSTLVQALLSTQIMSGHLISAGGTVYKNYDVRLVASALSIYNFLSSCLWVLFWTSISAADQQDTGFIAVLVLIYQSSLAQKRTKLWPLLAFLVVFVSGILTVLILLYPLYDRMYHMAGDKWKMVAILGSAFGTSLTLAVMVNALYVGTVLDEMVVPILVIFTATLQVVGFAFIYGCPKLKQDIKFLTGARTSSIWVVSWLLTPLLLIGVTGWWLRTLLRETIEDHQSLWPLGAVLISILIIMAVMSAVAVVKEEQYNLITKIASAFRPSRLWGPEDPTVRYNWIIRKPGDSDRLNNDDSNSADYYSTYPETILSKDTPKFNDEWQKNPAIYTVPELDKPDYYATYSLPRNKKKEYKFDSPNICVANEKMNGRIECKCNRHFTLNVPKRFLKNNISTNL
ncbi:sodium-dependent nutrient amino acid transporter 1 isoform X1 [Plutella xylostella]|uniref:sodium-dependent nutrient amino acid transporter 1 isoform X1 n=1 Tax=Plutella xylostella TaxID=51655 RepID=UPI002032DCFB|nr:sodium-dependent nutrient amino acid transporter 1 isoform X1 [Plutella xylostella]